MQTPTAESKLAQPTPRRIMVAAAHRLSSLGIPVHWVYGPLHPLPEDDRIDKRGKNPVGKGWQKRPYQEPAALVEIYQEGYNLGIHTGPVDGTEINLIAWDLDNDAAIEWAQKGGIPETPLMTLSSRGQHWYYLRPKDLTENIHTRLHKIKPEPYLDIDLIADGTGDGGNCIAAPSTHWTGFRYQEAEPWNRQLIAECPPIEDWFWKLYRPTAKVIPMPSKSTGIVASTPAQVAGSQIPMAERIFRAKEYAKRFDAAVSGSGASGTCFRLAQAMVCGFLLPIDQALAVMQADWNGRCKDQAGHLYPWSDGELLHKLEDASKGERLPGPWGWLIEKRTVKTAETFPTPSPTAPADDINFARLRKKLQPHTQLLINKKLLKDERCEQIPTRKPDGALFGLIAMLDPIPAGSFIADDIAEQFLAGGLACGAGYVISARAVDAVAVGCAWDATATDAPGVIAGNWSELWPLLDRFKPGAKITLVDPPAGMDPRYAEQHRLSIIKSPAAVLMTDGVKAVERLVTGAVGFELDGVEDIPITLPERKPWECNDEGNGKRLAAYFGNEIKFCAELGTWFIWDGRRWKDTPTETILSLAKRVRRLILTREADLALRNGDVKLKEALTKWYQETGAHSRRQNMVRDAQSEPGVLTHVSEMDVNPWEINCLNGVVDLKSGEFRPHDKGRKPIHTKLVNAEYREEAECPLWLKCLDMWMGGNQNFIKYLQRMCGWMLTGTVLEQAFFVLYGPGENGKSTFVKILMNILGNYAQSADPSLVMSTGDQKHTTPSSLAAVAKLRGARVVVCSETAQGQYLSEEQVKRLSSEEDISAKFMGKDFFDFSPTHKSILQTNFRPRVYSGGKGTWRRIKPIPFMMQISEAEKDPQLKDKLALEYAGILQWMIAGCRAWQAQGCKMIDPPEIHKAVDEYKVESDRLAEFMEDCVEKEGKGDSTVDMMNKTYQAWHKQVKGIQVDGKGMRMFTDALKDKGLRQGRTSRARVWLGIKLSESSTAYQMAMRMRDE